MRKSLWWASLLLLSIFIIASGVIGYFVHSMPFSWRTACATGAAPYKFIFPLCRAHIELNLLIDKQGAQENLNTSLNPLMAVYDETKGTIVAKRTLTLAGLFITQGADVNFVDGHGLTPLHAAVLYAEPVLVSLLLQHGADPKKRSFISHLGEALSPIELAKKIDEKGTRRGDLKWKETLSLLKLHDER